MVFGPTGCEPDAAIAHDHGGHPMPSRRGHLAAPGGLAVIMGVDVDKPRRHQPPCRVQFLYGPARNLSELGNTSVPNGNVSLKGSTASTINDQAIADHEIPWGIGLPCHTHLPIFVFL